MRMGFDPTRMVSFLGEMWARETGAPVLGGWGEKAASAAAEERGLR